MAGVSSLSAVLIAATPAATAAFVATRLSFGLLASPLVAFDDLPAFVVFFLDLVFARWGDDGRWVLPAQTLASSLA